MVLFSFLIEISKQSVDTPQVDKNVWRMIPDGDPHRVIEENSTLTMTCIYAFSDDDDQQNVRWKWELPDHLTKYPQVKIFENLTVIV